MSNCSKPFRYVDANQTIYGLQHQKWSNISRVATEIANFRKRNKVLKIEKNESKKLKIFHKLLEEMSQSPQYNQSKQSKSSASTENGYQETDNKSYLEKYW